MDLTDAQVQFAFYDEAKDEVTFPLAIEQDEAADNRRRPLGKERSRYRQRE